MKFLYDLWGDEYDDCFGELRFIKDGKIVQEWLSLPHRPSQEAALRDMNEKHGYDAFFGVLPRIRHSGTNKDVVPETSILWADLDAKTVGDPMAALNSFIGPLPQIIVHSGGGLHAYWRLREPVSTVRASAAMKTIADLTGGDKVQDPARVLRVPGTINWKYDPPIRARILRDDPHPVRFADIESLIPPPPRPRRTDVRAHTDGLPEWLEDLIATGAPKGQRSEAAFRACLWLVRYGRSYDEVRELFDAGEIGNKYRESGERWLERTYQAALKEA